MKVILLQDVAKVGRRFDIVTVPDGHALNQLIPKGMAKPATTATIKQVESMKGRMQQELAAEEEAFTKAVESLAGVTIVVPTQTNAEGKLFQAIKREDIVQAIASQTGTSIDPKTVVIPTPIKESGEHIVHLQLGNKGADITIEVTTA